MKQIAPVLLFVTAAISAMLGVSLALSGLAHFRIGVPLGVFWLGMALLWFSIGMIVRRRTKSSHSDPK